MAPQAAQAVLVPVLVDRQRCDAATTDAVKNMMLMNPPSAFSVRLTSHVFVTVALIYSGRDLCFPGRRVQHRLPRSRHLHLSAICVACVQSLLALQSTSCVDCVHELPSAMDQ